MVQRSFTGVALRACLVAFALPLVGCISDRTADITSPDHEVAEVKWGLDPCPSCEKQSPTDTESVRMQEAIQQHVDGQCVNQAYGTDVMGWLDDRLILGEVWIDEEVYDEEGWLGYWVPPSLRYQYDDIRLYLAQETANDSAIEQLAEVLVHEAGHEYGYDHDDPEMSNASQCVS
ncbi:MAG: hypothetical protein ACOC5J_02090 [Gemmatimonadota bacterium]